MTLSNDTLEKTVRYAYAGMTGEEIGRKMGVTGSAITSRLKQVGLDLAAVRKAKREGVKLGKLLEDKLPPPPNECLAQEVALLKQRVAKLESRKWWRF